MKEEVFTKELQLVNEKTTVDLKKTFLPFLENAETWKEKAESIVITSVDQVEDMALARDYRLELKRLRLDVEKKRKELKEESLMKGKAIDGIANIIKYIIVPLEGYLEDQEKFVLIKEQKRKQELYDKRLLELTRYGVDTEYINIMDMTESAYLEYLETSKNIYNKRKEEEKKAELAREEEEKKERERIEQIRVENEKLKKDAEIQEKKIQKEKEEREKRENERLKKERIEREKIEAEQRARLKEEQGKREKIEAELKLKKDNEEKIKKETEEKERKMKLSPDKDKLNEYANLISLLKLPELESEESKKIASVAIGMLNDAISYIRKETINL